MKNQDHHPSHKNTVVSLVTFTEVSVVEVIGAGAPAINPEEVKLCLVQQRYQWPHSQFMCPKIPHSVYEHKDSVFL